MANQGRDQNVQGRNPNIAGQNPLEPQYGATPRVIQDLKEGADDRPTTAVADARSYSVPNRVFENTSPVVDVYVIFTDMQKKRLLPDIDYVKMYLEQGKVLSKQVSDARGQGHSNVILRYSNLQKEMVQVKINITQEIHHNELTKNRFLAVVHLTNYYAGFGLRSALSLRLDFSQVVKQHADYLQPLIGAGFQFMGKIIKERLGMGNEGLAYYWICCHAMDYIALTGKLKKNRANYQEIGVFSLVDYLKDPDAYLALVDGAEQTTIEGATRNLGVKGEAIFTANEVASLTAFIESLVINEDASTAHRRVATEQLVLQAVNAVNQGVAAMPHFNDENIVVGRLDDRARERTRRDSKSEPEKSPIRKRGASNPKGVKEVIKRRSLETEKIKTLIESLFVKNKDCGEVYANCRRVITDPGSIGLLDIMFKQAYKDIHKDEDLDAVIEEYEAFINATGGEDKDEDMEK